MNISFFSADDYGKVVGKELISRGYNVLFDTLDENTEIVFLMCCPSAFNFANYLYQRKLEDFNYKGKIVCNVLDIPVWRLENPRFKDYYNAYRRMIEEADYVTTISQFTSNQLKELWNIDSVPLFRVFDSKKVEKYKRELPRYPNTIVCVSRFVPHKNFDLVILAIAGTDWNIKILGKSGSEMDTYYQLFKQHNVIGEVILNPPDNYVIDELSRATVVVHPSSFEGLSLVPKEALYCDTPVLISDIPVHKEYHKDTVTYVATNCIGDLRDKIVNRKWKSPEEGKKEIEQYTIERTTDKVEQWLKTHLK